MEKKRSCSRRPGDIATGAAIDALSDPAFVEWCYQKILRRTSDEQGRVDYLRALQQGLSRPALVEIFFNSGEYEDRFAACALFPPGHALSPLPSGAEIAAHKSFDWQPVDLPAIDLAENSQIELLGRLARHYPRLPFGRQPAPGRRYGFDNSSYSYADAILLGCMMLEFRPQRIIEIGSGHSSAAMLDINDQAGSGRTEFIFIDPDAGRLRALLAREESRVEIVEKRLQDVPLDLFSGLTARDILFIDSSHVSKVNSDVNRIFFEILPRLQKNVLVHIHDVFYPFEYPHDWLRRGWVWNEQYLLHAFLQYNSVFAIRLLSAFMIDRHRDWFSRHMPECLKNPGGCLWMEKTV